VKAGTLFIAPPGARNRREILFNTITTLCPGNNYSTVLYVCPDVHFVAHIKRLFHTYRTNSGASTAYTPFEVVTLKQLASELYATCGSQDVISDEIRTLILLQLIEENNLGYARLLSGLKNKINHYIPNRDLPEVKKDLDRFIFEEKAKERATSSLDILMAYEDLLKEKGLVDIDQVLSASISLINEHLTPSTVVIDGFFDPSPLEVSLLDALMQNAENVLVLAEEGTSLAETGKERTLSPRRLKPASRRETCRYHVYASVEDEVEGIARNTKKLLLDGMRPWDITLSFPSISKYAPMVRRVFHRHGIPVNIDEQSVAASRPALLIQELITCVEEDYPRNDFLSVLTSPFFPAIPSIVREHAVSLSYRAGIITGKESWLSLTKTLNDITGMNNDRGRLTGEFQKGIEKVIAIMEPVSRAQDIEPFADALETALQHFGFFESLSTEGADSSGTTMEGVINSQFTTLRRFAEIRVSHKKHPHSPGFYLRFLLETLSGADTRVDGVQVMSFEQASSLETDALFFGGMIEGDFPSKPAIDPILPEQVKKELGMPYLDYYLKRQRRYFHRLMNISDREPFFSCPSAEGDKIFLPSPFLDWEKALRPENWHIFSPEDVLIREGRIKNRHHQAAIFRDNAVSLNRTSLKLIREKLRGYLSVTDIDFYRKCPLRFYIEKILKIEPEEPPRFEVEARLWGSLAHRVMEHLFREGDVDPEDLDTRLQHCLDAALHTFAIGDFWKKVAREIFQKLLPKLAEEEHTIRREGYRPAMVEKKLTAQVDGLKLKGKIDRIDKKSKEQRAKIKDNSKGSETVILLDYKTGTIDHDSLQMPLYALMWQENSQDPVDKIGYYSLKDGKVSWYPKKISMEQYIEEAFDTTKELARRMREGHFPAEPCRGTECRYCSHSPMCSRNN
jgi:ATP-dependent helicase/nuclease subunit B